MNILKDLNLTNNFTMQIKMKFFLIALIRKLKEAGNIQFQQGCRTLHYHTWSKEGEIVTTILESLSELNIH